MAILALTRPLLSALALLVIALGTAPACGQAGEAKPAAEEVQALIKTLEDEGARARLVAQLRSLLAAQGQATQGQAAPEPVPAQPEAEVKPDSLAGLLIGGIAERVQQFGRDLQGMVDMLRDLPRLFAGLRSLVTDQAARGDVLIALLNLAAILGAALLAEFAVRLALARPRQAVERREPRGVPLRALWLLAWTGLHLLPILAFQLGAYAVLSLTQPDRTTQLVALVLVNANIFARFAVLIARFLTAPDCPALRLLPFESETAAYLFVWARRLANIVVYGVMAAEAALVLDLPARGYQLWIHLVGLVAGALLAIFVLQNRRGFGDWLRGNGDAAGGMAAGLQGVRARLADVWHIFALLYIAAIYLVWAFGIPGGFEFILRASVLTAVVLAAGRLVHAGIARALSRSFAVSADLAQRFPGLERRTNLYLPLLKRVLDGAVWIVVGLLVLEVWGIGAFTWVASPIGRRIVGAALTILFILALAAVVWEIASALIERHLQRITAPGADGKNRARLRTFLPLLRNVLFIVLVVIVTLVVLSEVGVNIAPLLAGAGVVGLAIGFGSQALVRDVITGLFILFEDTINVGDVVDVAGSSGVVEGITIRTLRLRDMRGNLHTIPFGSVGSVKNMSKEFGYYVFDIGIARADQIDAATETLRAVDAEMRAEPAWKTAILAPIEIPGVDSFTGSGLVIRARIKAEAGRQWAVGREYNRRLKLAFDRHGIAMTG
jgi:small conductance mechanosensitive channel